LRLNLNIDSIVVAGFYLEWLTRPAKSFRIVTSLRSDGRQAAAQATGNYKYMILKDNL
jgi:hypothetical protein